MTTQRENKRVTSSANAAKLATIVLAAGGSSRYGKCKQLIDINGASLIRAAINKLSSILRHEQIYVVVGANSEDVIHGIEGLPVNVIHNTHWQTGIASSLKAGIKSIKPGCKAVMITLCDQPLISAIHLEQLIKLWSENHSKIIASTYAGTLGTPAIIPIDLCPQLLELEGDMGAKPILEKTPNRLVKLPIPEAEFDIDTPADLENLKKML